MLHRLLRFLFLTLALFSGEALAQDKRVALLIGNSAYANVPTLPNPRNDAAKLGDRLRALGFDVTVGVDLDRSGVISTLVNFGRKAESADVALFFYAGHGLQVNGQNYIVPTDARVEYEAELDLALIPFPVVMQQLQRGSRINIVLLDACRDNPFAKDLSRTLGTRSASALGRGLSRVQTTSGTFIAFATQPDNVAQDGDGQNSPFTEALLKYIDRPGASLSDLMIDVRNDVMQATNGKQIPWDSSSLTGRFSFKIEGTVTIAPTPNAAVTPQSGTDRATLEMNVWKAIEGSTSAAPFEKFLRDFPEGLFAEAARQKLSSLRLAADMPKQAPIKSGPVFNEPTVNGARLDWCARWGVDCGQSAADAFCRSKDYPAATEWTITRAARTIVAADNRFCDAPNVCYGWGSITCGTAAPKAADRTFAAPKVNNVAADWCEVWGDKCGQAGADAFCRSQKFARAVAWKTVVTNKTWVIGSKQLCAMPGCVALKDVGCAK